MYVDRRVIVLGFLLTITDERNQEKIKFIYNKYHDDMIRFAKFRLKNSGVSSYELDAEDVVQNAFLKIVKYIDVIDTSRPENQLKSYIFSIVVNEVKNAMADMTFFDDIDIYSEKLSDEDFFENLRDNLQYDELVEKIKRLDEKYSITMLLYYCEDFDVKAIADIIGIAEKTVYTRLERGKRLLLDNLSKEA